MRSSINRATTIVFLTLAVAVAPAAASTIAIGVGVFGPGSTLTTFTGLSNGTEVDGLVVDGIMFDYSLGVGHVIIAAGPFAAGPRITNNVAPPTVVSIGNSSGMLTLFFPSLIDTFGYGYAVQAGGALANATTISLFNDAIAVGSMSYNGVPDPIFTGGFAGIQSTLPFNRANLTFTNSAPAFAVDNIRTQAAAARVPDSSGTLALFGFAATGIAVVRRRLGRS